MFLQVKDIHKSFGAAESLTEVLKGIDFSCARGEFCVLLGPSGCGKSTLLNIIGGIDTPDSGDIIIDGKGIRGMEDAELTRYRRVHLGYVFQQYNLIPNLTVRENVEVGAYLGKHPLDVDEILEMLQLDAHADKIPNQLSGGQQQRTSIGRAIVKNPDILLCDEPTGALDYQTSKEILKLIETVHERYRTTVLMVTHNTEIGRMADRVIRMKDGAIVDDQTNASKVAAERLEW